MVLYEEFKDYLYRAELWRASFTLEFDEHFIRYRKGGVMVEYRGKTESQANRLIKIEVKEKDLSEYFPLLVPERENETLYDYIPEEAIRFVYDHAFPTHKN